MSFPNIHCHLAELFTDFSHIFCFYRVYIKYVVDYTRTKSDKFPMFETHRELSLAMPTYRMHRHQHLPGLAGPDTELGVAVKRLGIVV